MRDVLRDDSTESPLLIKRVPFICLDIKNIHTEIQKINEKLDEKFVNQDQFWPVKSLVYGLVGILGVGVIGAILAMILK